MTDDLKDIWAKVDARTGPQRMETEAEHIARDMREGNFPNRSDPIQVPVNQPSGMTDAPKRITVDWDEKPRSSKIGTALESDLGDFEYILATPTVLAADPAVKALIAAERERCAGECDRTAREADMFGDKHGRQISERTAAAIRGEKP